MKRFRELSKERKDKLAVKQEAIRNKCLDCCIYQVNEVKLCTAVLCPLWEHRFGKVEPKSLVCSKEQRLRLEERGIHEA
jgi:hypothetical protein